MAPPSNPAIPPSVSKTPANRWAIALTSLSVIGLIIVLVILFMGVGRLTAIQFWGILAVVIFLLLVGLGLGANGKWYGFLIDSRNRTSLSRMQISLWTILTISAFLAIALPRSIPGALGKAGEEAVSACRANFLENDEKIEDITTFRQEDPEAAAAAEARAAAECVPDPLKIRFPEELLIALGISTASVTGSTLIMSNKRNKIVVGLMSDLKAKVDGAEKLMNEKKAALDAINKKIGDATEAMNNANERLKENNKDAAAKQDLDNANMILANETPKRTTADEEYKNARESFENLQTQIGEAREGVLKVNATPQEATLSDMFQGDEIGNYYLIDLSKVQMFFFTIAVIVAYAAALGNVMNDQSVILNPLGVDFPSFSSSLNTLLAISHTGYLTVKSVDHTKTTA